jgi:hypothetical protein
MTREDIDASLRGMRWAAEAKGDNDTAAKIDAVRALLPAGQVDEAWGKFVRELLTTLVPISWEGVDKLPFLLAAKLSAMCHDAKGDPANLPAKVKTVYAAQYGRKPHAGTLGNRKKVAGAFAIAEGYHRGGIDAAAQWMEDTGVMDIGERNGLTFPGLGRS